MNPVVHSNQEDNHCRLLLLMNRCTYQLDMVYMMRYLLQKSYRENIICMLFVLWNFGTIQQGN